MPSVSTLPRGTTSAGGGSPVDRITNWALRHRSAVLVTWTALLVVGGLSAASLDDKVVLGGETPSSSQSQVVARALERSSLPSLFVLVRWDRERPTADRTHDLGKVEAAIRRVPGVTRVTVLGSKSDIAGRSAPGARPLSALDVTTRGGTDGAKRVASELSEERKGLSPEGATVFVGGFAAYGHELTQLARSDLSRAERVGVPIVFVVLLLTFASLWAALIPMAIALSGLVMGLGVLSALAGTLDISEYVENSATMIGIALGVDYAMFLVQRAREAVRAGEMPDAAIGTAMRTTGVAVLWSGATVLAAEATLLIPDTRATRTAALGMMLVTGFAVVSAVILAPVIMSLLKRRLFPPSLQYSMRYTPSRWQRWARHVTRRAPAWLAATTLAMVMLTIPVLDLHRSVDFSATSTLPPESSVRQAYALASAEFGPGALSPVQVVLRQPADDRAAARFAQVVSADRHVAAVQAGQAVPLEDGVGHVLPITIVTRDGPFHASTRQLVESLREGLLRGQLEGFSYAVGGETAATIDMKRAMFDALPLVLAILVSVVAAILFFAFRSVVLPLKAGVLVLLSLGASLGGLVMLTQTEVGVSLIGASEPTEINPFVPITIVAIVIALSTDYEVILIARIAEHFRRSGDNTQSIISGVGQTGGVITSAAAIMIAVFLGFALADLPTLKHLGVGLALAVLLDATIVRGILVPATMQLLGRRNWWLPRRARATRHPPRA
jgi:RND superfamily putative drug exporter